MIRFKATLVAIALALVATVAHAQVLGIATNAQGSLYYSVGTAIARVMQQDAHLTARVQPLSGSSSYTPLINRGQVEFGLLNAVDVVNAYTGVANFEDHKNPDLRLVGVVFPIQNGIAVPDDSPIKSIADLKGMRMPNQFTAQSTMGFVQDSILATGSLTTTDMDGFPVADMFKGMQALGEGKVDAALSCFTCAKAKEVNVALAAHGGMRFLPLPDTPEAMAAMHKLFSGARTRVFSPSPAFTGIAKPTRLFEYSAFLVSSTHVADDVVYKTVKAIAGNKAALVATTAAMKGFNPKAMTEENIVPYHRGAEKFFKEVGQWPPKKR